MAKVDHFSTATEIIERDRALSERVANDSRSSLTDLSRSDEMVVKEFFQDHFERFPGPTSNLPHGAEVGPYLLIGASPVVDLHPKFDETSFQQRYGITFYEAEMLADEGLIVPNLYWRNPVEWRDAHDGMDGLLKRSIAMGERIGHFLGARYPSNGEFVRERFDELKKEFAGKVYSSSNQSGLQEIFVTDADINTAAIRWGYLDIYSPDQSKRAFELTQLGDFPELLDHLHVQKWLACTQITGALGGSFVLGPGNLDLVYRSGHRLTTSEADVVRALLPGQREVLEYLWRELVGTVEHGYAQISCIQEVASFLRHSDNALLRDAVLSATDGLAKDCLAAQLSEDRVAECKELIADYERRLALWGGRFQKTASGVATAEVLAGAATAAGAFNAPAWLLLLGLTVALDEVRSFVSGTDVPSLSRALGEKYANARSETSIIRAFALVKTLRGKKPVH